MQKFEKKDRFKAVRARSMEDKRNGLENVRIWRA